MFMQEMNLLCDSCFVFITCSSNVAEVSDQNVIYTFYTLIWRFQCKGATVCSFLNVFNISNVSHLHGPKLNRLLKRVCFLRYHVSKNMLFTCRHLWNWTWPTFCHVVAWCGMVAWFLMLMSIFDNPHVSTKKSAIQIIPVIRTLL